MKYTYVGFSGYTYTVEVNTNDREAPLTVALNVIDEALADAKRFICTVEMRLCNNDNQHCTEDSIMTNIEMSMMEMCTSNDFAYLEYIGICGTRYTIEKCAEEYCVTEYHGYDIGNDVWCVNLNDAKDYLRIIETNKQNRAIRSAIKNNHDTYNTEGVLSGAQIAARIENGLRKVYLNRKG